MADTDRCPRCDRPECRAESLRVAHETAREAWLATEDGSDEDRCGRKAQLDALWAWQRAQPDCEAHRVDWRARALAAERERDEARRHARDHHVEGGCLTCAAMVAERDETRAEAERDQERRAIDSNAITMLGEELSRLREQIATLTAERDEARNTVWCVCAHSGVEHRTEEATGAARECRHPGCSCAGFANVHGALAHALDRIHCMGKACDAAWEERRVAVAMLHAPEVAMRMCAELGVLYEEHKAALAALTAERDTLRADLAAATAQATKQERLVEQQRAEIARLSDAVAAMRVRAATELERIGGDLGRELDATPMRTEADHVKRGVLAVTMSDLRRRAAALREEH